MSRSIIKNAKYQNRAKSRDTQPSRELLIFRTVTLLNASNFSGMRAFVYVLCVSGSLSCSHRSTVFGESRICPSTEVTGTPHFQGRHGPEGSDNHRTSRDDGHNDATFPCSKHAIRQKDLRDCSMLVLAYE